MTLGVDEIVYVVSEGIKSNQDSLVQTHVLSELVDQFQVLGTRK